MIAEQFCDTSKRKRLRGFIMFENNSSKHAFDIRTAYN